MSDENSSALCIRLNWFVSYASDDESKAVNFLKDASVLVHSGSRHTLGMVANFL